MPKKIGKALKPNKPKAESKVEEVVIIKKEVFKTEKSEQIFSDVVFLNSPEFAGLDDASKKIECQKIREKEGWPDIIAVVKKYLV